MRCGRTYTEDDGILDLRFGREGTAAYDPHYFGVLKETEGRHFWFVARSEVIVESMRRGIPDLGERRLFDIGCGTGSLLASMSRAGVAVSGACDAYRESLNLVRCRVDTPLVLVDEGRDVPLGEGQSLIGMFDVLEHIDDDLQTLRHLHHVLAPGGFLVLTVPAHEALFGPLDAAACHRRRYGRRHLRLKLEAAGFRVESLSHFMMPLAPVLLLARWLERRRGPSERPPTAAFRVVPVVNALVLALLRVERVLMRFVALPFGSSLVAVAQRPLGSVLR